MKLVKYIIVLLLAQLTLIAEVQVSSMFGDHMVLQRDLKVPVWGKATPGETITVKFNKQKVSTKADKDGKWLIKLSPLKASAQGKVLTITGNNEVKFKDVLVGEVWVCSGQSNMQLGWGNSHDPYYSWGAVKDLAALIPDAKTKPIRSYTVPNFAALTPQDSCTGSWSIEPSGSAVAFGFSYFLNQTLDVPVAVITACWGSSFIEGWMPIELTQQLPNFKKKMKKFEATKKEHIIELIDQGLKSGKGSKAWTRKDNIFTRTCPNILYNAMMNPVIPYGCRGMVWYQGEANSKEPANLYAKSLSVWIESLRKKWNRDDFYLTVVMLPGYGRDNGRPDAKSWAPFREAQKSILNVKYTGVVNAIDLGEARNIHPRDKKPLCERIVKLVSRTIYGKDILGQGPFFKSHKVAKGNMIINFSYAKGLKTTDGKAPTGFWLAGKDGIWYPAQAKIVNESVVVNAKEVTKPVACRYAYCGKPVVNLVNTEDLPAYPFSIGDK